MLSVVIATRNSATTLPAAIAALEGEADEVIVVDGGSDDGTVALARSIGARVLRASGGHGASLAEGCAAASGDWLLLLRADTRLAPGWFAAAARVMAGTPERAAYFRFALEAGEAQARRMERMIGWTSHHLGLPSAGQGILISRQLFDSVGGLRPLPAMAELDLARRIGARRLAGLQIRAVSCAADWRREGWWRHGLRDLGCLALCFLGLPTRMIARMHG